MKKLIFLFVFCVSGLLSQTTSAQISFRINISSQPLWGPTGYDHVEYYYLPDIEAYYFVPKHQFIFFEKGRWITQTYLPARYKNFNMYNARKYVINDPKPYLHHNEYKSKYANEGYSNHQNIRDSRDSKYVSNRNHPEYNNWKNSQRNQKNKKSQKNQKNQGHDNESGRK
jgi:hypothetical protein